MLPNIARLDLARTGTLAPGEAADQEAQYLSTPDYFISVLEQVENISDLDQACDVVKTWCGTNRGRNEACKSPAADQAWASLIAKLFGRYAPPPSKDVPWEKHFYGLCNMGPVARLVRAGKRRYDELLLDIRTEIETGWRDASYSLQYVLSNGEAVALHRLAREAAFPIDALEQAEAVAPEHVWYTPLDHKADVALALTKIAEWRNLEADAFVHDRIASATADLNVELQWTGLNGHRERAQLAKLVSWLFGQHPNARRMEQLLQVDIDAITTRLYETIAEGSRTHVLHGSAPKEDEDVVTECLWALKEIAEYKGHYGHTSYTWSVHAIPPFSAAARATNAEQALMFYLRNGTNKQKRYVCDLIHHALDMSVSQVSAGVPDDPRKYLFAKNLVTFGALSLLGSVGISDYDLSRRSVGALASIARQLSTFPLPKMQR